MLKAGRAKDTKPTSLPITDRMVEIEHHGLRRRAARASLVKCLFVRHQLQLSDMNRLRKFLRLPVPEQILLVRAFVLLGVVRVGLWLLPFKTLQRLLSQLVQTCARSWNKGRFRTERRI